MAFSPAAAGNTDEETFFTTTASPSLFVAGTNVLAAEVHQANATSSDLGFDLELIADPSPSRLSLTRADRSAALAWPVWAMGSRLQSAAQLAPVTSWSNLPAPVSATNGQHRATIAASGAQHFFRLANP